MPRVPRSSQRYQQREEKRQVMSLQWNRDYRDRYQSSPEFRKVVETLQITAFLVGLFFGGCVGLFVGMGMGAK
jgi:hypothetical protein